MLNLQDPLLRDAPWNRARREQLGHVRQDQGDSVEALPGLHDTGDADGVEEAVGDALPTGVEDDDAEAEPGHVQQEQGDADNAEAWPGWQDTGDADGVEEDVGDALPHAPYAEDDDAEAEPGHVQQDQGDADCAEAWQDTGDADGEEEDDEDVWPNVPDASRCLCHPGRIWSNPRGAEEGDLYVAEAEPCHVHHDQGDADCVEQDDAEESYLCVADAEQ